MNDQPPPDSAKKPRRRGPPRKRAAKKATQAVEAPAQDTPLGDAAAQATPTDAAVRAEAPLHDGGAQAMPGGDGSTRQAVIDAPDAAAAETVVTGDGAPRAAAPAEAQAPHAASVANDAPPAPAQTRRPDMPAAAPRHAAGKTAKAPRGDAPAVAPHAAAPQPPAPAPESAPMRQPSLRPGELIRVPLSVRWRDLDAFNHVNNSKYLSYLEEARLRWMLTVPGMGLDEHVAPVVAASNLNYRRPIEWPGDVVIELFVERLGGSSLTIGHRIVDSRDGGVVYCDGHVVMVWIDRESGRSAPLPESVRAACR